MSPREFLAATATFGLTLALLAGLRALEKPAPEPQVVLWQALQLPNGEWVRSDVTDERLAEWLGATS